jgi:hypothetical protein
MLTSLLLLCCAVPAAGDDPPAPAKRPVVMKVHSLAGIVDECGREELTLGLLPSPVGSGKPETGSDASDGAGSLFMNAEDLCTLLRESVDRELWEDGSARLDLAEQNRLLVVAPAETQEKIADFLNRIATTLCPTPTLSLAVLNGAAGFDGGIYVDAATADKFDSELGVARRAQLTLAGRGIASATDFAASSAVFDWEVEIAQGAIIADPVVVATHAGLELAASAVPAESGMYVALLLREAEPAADPVARVIDGSGLLVAQQLLADRPAAGLLQHPRFGFVSYAGSCFVPGGKALLLPVKVATHLGEIGFTLDLRLSGELPPARARLDAKGSGDGQNFHLAFASCGLSVLDAVQLLPLPPQLFDQRWNQSIDAPCWRASLAPRDEGSGRLVELARTVADAALADGRGSLAAGGNWLRMQLPNDLIDDVGAALATLDQHVSGELDGRIVQGDAVLATFRLPYVDGRPLALWSGAQGARVSDWDVDVANEAQIPNPEVESWVDGFALELKVTRDARGRPLVHANGVLNFLEGEPQKVELRDQSRLAIEQIRARRATFDELRALPEKGGKARFGGADLGLEIEVKSR